MTDEWVLESNKLIAEFMGSDHFVFDGVDEIPITEWREVRTLRFHSSWDWLMSVTKKVCDTIEKLLDSIKGDTDEDHEADLMDFYSTFVEINFFEITIKDIYMQCVSFINWYNNNYST